MELFQLTMEQHLLNLCCFMKLSAVEKLPQNQRVQWRGDSGLRDGSEAQIDLVGGYYDAGDTVKFGFPVLAWSAVEFQSRLKANPQPEVLHGEAGDGDSDHAWWERSEDMTTPGPSDGKRSIEPVMDF
ncbi:hypothetical protein DKX38_020663 [Salix brachista]|uniref:cellulase n=1 Tax=Salix brachista TaxID=2182728 RepID=A0A5N5K7H9_9ROSI|nr:hypothetical protein DKX38_020663 [Salix brachista]